MPRIKESEGHTCFFLFVSAAQQAQSSMLCVRPVHLVPKTMDGDNITVALGLMLGHVLNNKALNICTNTHNNVTICCSDRPVSVDAL
jgi:hypothetical protein